MRIALTSSSVHDEVLFKVVRNDSFATVVQYR